MAWFKFKRVRKKRPFWAKARISFFNVIGKYICLIDTSALNLVMKKKVNEI